MFFARTVVSVCDQSCDSVMLRVTSQTEILSDVLERVTFSLREKDGVCASSADNPS